MFSNNKTCSRYKKELYEIGVYDSNSIVYDDDMIYILAKLFDCKEDYADKIRRGYFFLYE